MIVTVSLMARLALRFPRFLRFLRVPRILRVPRVLPGGRGF